MGDGNFTGCKYGYGDWAPFTGPLDCQSCKGSGFEDMWTMLPHSEFGDKECCGCLGGVIRETNADITCNECGVVLRTVPAAELAKVFDGMELSLGLATEMCPHCKAVNLFPGFTRMMAFTCQECGKGVDLPEEK